MLRQIYCTIHRIDKFLVPIEVPICQQLVPNLNVWKQPANIAECCLYKRIQTYRSDASNPATDQMNRI